MQVYPQQVDQKLKVGLKAALAYFRGERNFDAASYVAAKTALLNDYMQKHGLKACVIAVSGGIDSALVLALVQRASHLADSPIEKIVPICLPVFTPGAASNQEGATHRGEEVAAALGLKAVVIDLSAAHLALKTAVDSALGVEGGDWASGQLTATTRTPANYYVTSLLSQSGYPSILVGTTNRDEGAYFGYVGKASDAIVDVQLIADLHKSEVYRTAAYLQIPSSVLDAAPAGDMYDGRTDADVYGASYDAAELYLNLLCVDADTRSFVMASWSAEDRAQYTQLAQNLSNLHRYNAHKYISEWPGVFLNILPSTVPGGWRCGPSEPVFAQAAEVSRLSGLIKLPQEFLSSLATHRAPATTAKDLKDVSFAIDHPFSATTVQKLLTLDEVDSLLETLRPQAWFPVGSTGYEREYRAGDPVGSWRLRAYDELLARVLWLRLKAHLDALLIFPHGSSQDADGSLIWRAVGVSPLFRFIKYENAGSLVAHYDAPFDYGNGCRTLKSLIIYLTDETDSEGGVTRFVHDEQDQLCAYDRAYAKDWPRCANPGEVLAEVVPVAGNALCFDHRILHDSSPLLHASTARPKIIIRTDIIYQQIATPCAG